MPNYENIFKNTNDVRLNIYGHRDGTYTVENYARPNPLSQTCKTQHQLIDNIRKDLQAAQIIENKQTPLKLSNAE